MPVDYIAILLVLLFSIVFAIGMFQTMTTLQTRNKVLTLRNAIVFALTLSALLRVVFWIKVCCDTFWDITIMLLLFYLPLFLQRLAISLLLVFYAEASLEKTRLPFRLCICANIVLFSLDVTIALLTAQSLQGHRQSDTRDMTLVYVVYSSLVDMAIVFALGFFGHLFHQQTLNNTGNLLATWSKSSLSNFNYINILLFCSYLLRAIGTIAFYCIPSWQGRLEYNGPHQPTGLGVLLFFLLIEIIPTALVLVILFNIGVNNNSSRSKYEYPDSSFFENCFASSNCEHYYGWLINCLNGGGDSSKDHVYLGLHDDFDARLLSIEDARVHVLEGNNAASLDGESSDNSLSSSYRNSLTANLSALKEENQMMQTKQIPQEDTRGEALDSSTAKYSPDDTGGILAPGSYDEHHGGEGPYARRLQQLLGHSLRTPSPQMIAGSLRSTSPQMMMSTSPIIKGNDRESPSQNLGSVESESYLYSNYVTEENGERYADFISPRDILLAHGRKK